MNVVDSCGWLEYYAAGPNATFFAKVIELTDDLIVPTICVAEVFRTMHRQLGEGAALRAVNGMGRCRLAPLDAKTAVAAARTGLELKLPLANSIILATARAHRATLFTQDVHFEKIEGVKYRKAR